MPDLLQAVTEVDHDSQDLISVKQLAHLLAAARVEQLRMAHQ